RCPRAASSGGVLGALFGQQFSAYVFSAWLVFRRVVLRSSAAVASLSHVLRAAFRITVFTSEHQLAQAWCRLTRRCSGLTSFAARSEEGRRGKESSGEPNNAGAAASARAQAIGTQSEALVQ